MQMMKMYGDKGSHCLKLASGRNLSDRFSLICTLKEEVEMHWEMN